MEYVKRKEAMQILGISYVTLYKIAENKEIDTLKIGHNTLYNVNKYLREKNISKKDKIKVCYCRVSSNKQKKQLEIQKEYMKDKFPTYQIIEDISSGLDFNRKGIQEIIDKAINGELEELIIAHKDRLGIFGFELIEWLIKKYSDGKIIILNKKEENTPNEELIKDISSILNIYSEKVKELKKYKYKIKETIKNNKK